MQIGGGHDAPGFAMPMSGESQISVAITFYEGSLHSTSNNPGTGGREDRNAREGVGVDRPGGRRSIDCPPGAAIPMLKESPKAIANRPDIVGRTSRDDAQGIWVIPFAFRTGIQAWNHAPGLAIPVLDQRSIIGAGGSAGEGPGDPDIIAGQREDTRESVTYIPRIRAGHNLPERASRLMSRRSVAGREQRASKQHEKNHRHAGDAGMAHRILFLSRGSGW